MLGRDVIGQYVIQQKIGAGGMGAVYLAEQTSMGRKAVIKVLHPWLSKDPTIAARFDNEARAVARLSDPHIVQLFNYGDMGEGTLFLAMEHLNGRTLSQVLRAEGRLSVERAVDIACQISEALSESHRQDVVHRDLKPSNIMLLDRPGGELVKVLDFGVAKLRGSSHTSTGQPVGTPRYMSPEQLAGNEVDGRSDLYALGLVTYEMLAGEPPFVADTPVGYVHKHISEPPPPLAIAAPDAPIPTAVSEVIMGVLAKQPQDRPNNAAGFADALRAAMRQPLVGTSAVMAPVVTAANDDDDDDRPQVGRLLAGLVALALLGGGAYVALTRIAAAPEAIAPPRASGDTDAPVQPEAPPVPPPRDDPASATAGEGGEAPPDPTASTGTTALPPLSAEASELLERSVTDLEKEFFALLEVCNIPPSAKQQVTDSYGTMARGLAPGPAAERQRKTYLVQVIIGYRNTPPLPKGFERPIPELESILRALEAPTTAEQRMHTYNEMVKGFHDNARTDADREYWRRYALVSLIGTFSGDEAYLDKHPR
jgi:serine/threonine-protein kinase